jgi:hypothetical protein
VSEAAGGAGSDSLPGGTGSGGRENGSTSVSVEILGGAGGGAVSQGGASGQAGQHPVSVSWDTPTVSLVAEDFWLDIDGQRYTTEGAAVEVGGDPGNAVYTTLELAWTEHGRKMRFFLYFKADGEDWWSYEMRTYDGQADADWLTYHGPFIRTPVGRSFSGSLDFKNETSDKIRGEIHLHGLVLGTTLGGT